MSFILAGIVVVVTIAWTGFLLLANGMSDAPSQEGFSIWPSLIIGFGLAGLLVASHWLSFIGW